MSEPTRIKVPLDGTAVGSRTAPGRIEIEIAREGVEVTLVIDRKAANQASVLGGMLAEAGRLAGVR